jgi:2-polyprenyl-3-methyl-5-hydroxy-6-metoxy-1,4-benzoquinol methylase
MSGRKEKNIENFNRDVDAMGSYQYTGSSVSGAIANGNISAAVASVYPFRGMKVIDLGCGDGTYTMEYPGLGASRVLGVDPAAKAVERAGRRAAELGLSAEFMTGDIYNLQITEKFDCAVLRGVLHHVPDPRKAIAVAAGLADSVVIAEPNGMNPALKILEKVSKYHREHDEKSYHPGSLRQWCADAGLRVEVLRFINLVPYFCPDWMARLLNFITPAVERVPLARNFCLGQTIILARRNS